MQEIGYLYILFINDLKAIRRIINPKPISNLFEYCHFFCKLSFILVLYFSLFSFESLIIQLRSSTPEGTGSWQEARE